MKNYLRPYSNNSLLNLFDDFFNETPFSLAQEFRQKGNYNIMQLSNDTYQISLNVAGFKKSDIEISHNDDVLIIHGSVKQEYQPNNNKYLYKGFASSFSNSFSLGKDSEILGAQLQDGILHITIKEKNPIKRLAKKIPIR